VLLVANLSAKSLLGSQMIVADYVRTLRTLNVLTLGIVRPKLLIALHIKIDIRAFIRQTELDFQALRAGFTVLLSHFMSATPTLKVGFF